MLRTGRRNMRETRPAVKVSPWHTRHESHLKLISASKRMGHKFSRPGRVCPIYLVCLICPFRLQLRAALRAAAKQIVSLNSEPNRESRIGELLDRSNSSGRLKLTVTLSEVIC